MEVEINYDLIVNYKCKYKMIFLYSYIYIEDLKHMRLFKQYIKIEVT